MLVVFVLLAYVLFDHLLIESDGADEVSSCPEGFLGDGLFVGELVVEADGGFAFEEPKHVGHAESRRDFEYHVDMVGFGSAFDHLDVLLSQEFSDDLSYALPYLAIQLFFPVLGHDDDVKDAIPSRMSLGTGCERHGGRRVTPFDRRLSPFRIVANAGIVEHGEVSPAEPGVYWR